MTIHSRLVDLVQGTVQPDTHTVLADLGRCLLPPLFAGGDLPGVRAEVAERYRAEIIKSLNSLPATWQAHAAELIGGQVWEGGHDPAQRSATAP